MGSGPAKDYTYDEQGNTTKRYGPTGTAQSLEWDIEGELSLLTEGTKTTEYLYDAGGDLLIRRGPDRTVLYLAGQELHYNSTTKKFTAQRYYPAGDATAVRTETSLSWMVDDHHGTASMTVDATTQAVTRRYTKPFGETRGTAPSAWPDDKGFLGKPADPGTGLTHVSAREYDPALGRFLSVDPILAPEDHESLNGYAYANNTPVTKSDPTGLRPVTDCERGCNTPGGGRYHSYMTPGPNGTWVYHSTQTYAQPASYQKSNGSTGSGAMTVTVTTRAGVSAVQIVFKKGPDPKPARKDGSDCKSCYAMGANPHYDPTASDLPDRPKLATWQKVLLGVVTVVGLGVAVAPLAALAWAGCLATAPVCAATIAETATGGASGGSAVVGVATVGSTSGTVSRGAQRALLGLEREEVVAKMIGGTLAKGPNGQDIKKSMPNVGSTGLDVFGPNGEFVFVGGPNKARNPADFGKKLRISKYVADQEGVPAWYFLTDDTPGRAIDQRARCSAMIMSTPSRCRSRRMGDGFIRWYRESGKIQIFSDQVASFGEHGVRISHPVTGSATVINVDGDDIPINAEKLAWLIGLRTSTITTNWWISSDINVVCEYSYEPLGCQIQTFWLDGLTLEESEIIKSAVLAAVNEVSTPTRALIFDDQGITAHEGWDSPVLYKGIKFPGAVDELFLSPAVADRITSGSRDLEGEMVTRNLIRVIVI
ncbi:RHS repeat domain-containing protein [Streptomyces sp. NPDC091377]|uniref:RHS repeat domain-containing protein n=1 Tax=Streptomyces sp. NPDC091377 TaxID=3365995 RepID=UPI0037F7CF2D